MITLKMKAFKKDARYLTGKSNFDNLVIACDVDYPPVSYKIAERVKTKLNNIVIESDFCEYGEIKFVDETCSVDGDNDKYLVIWYVFTNKEDMEKVLSIDRFPF